jgi:hypothetical protein
LRNMNIRNFYANHCSEACLLLFQEIKMWKEKKKYVF